MAVDVETRGLSGGEKKVRASAKEVLAFAESFLLAIHFDGPSVTIDTTLRSASHHQTTADVGRTAQGEEHDRQIVRGDNICL